MRRFHGIVRVIVLLLVLLSASSYAYAFNVESLVPDELDCRIQYTHLSKNHLKVEGYSLIHVIHIGTIEVKKITRDFASTSFTATYHLQDRDFDVTVPLIYRRENILSPTDSEEEQLSENIYSGVGLGDIEFSFSKQSGYENGVFTVSSFGVTTPTGLDPYSVNDDQVPLGSGHLGLRCGITGGKKIDPLMLFASGNYTFNLPRRVSIDGGEIDIDPGDVFSYSFGFVYALNQSLALNMRFAQRFTGLTGQDGDNIVGSDTVGANMYIGASYLDEKNVNYEFNLGIGLTEESPDFNLSLSFPINI